MSLNSTHVGDGVLLYQGEFIILYCDGVTLTFENSEPMMKGSTKGRIYLTTHRMIFRSNEQGKGLLSFSFPFYTLFDLGLEQPVFGANYIRGIVKAETNGGWTGQANFKMTFKNGGAIEFGQALTATANVVSRFKQSAPPPYSPPMTMPYMPAQQYMAPPGPAPYGFHVDKQRFPDMPPQNHVYMVESPPPYPGVMGAPGPSPPYAYVDPNGSGYIYPQATAPPPMGPPPAYSVNESKKAV